MVEKRNVINFLEFKFMVKILSYYKNENGMSI